MNVVENLDPIMSFSQVTAIVNRSKSTILRAVAEGRFPSPLRIGKRSIGWRASQIKSYLDSLPSMSPTEISRVDIRDRSGRTRTGGPRNA